MIHLCLFKKKKKVKRKLYIYAGVLTILLSACSTDFEVTGDWKETMVVYGLLDQSQAKQYIKINKAFLGEGNAFEYAEVKDSVQYARALNVTLQRIRGGNVVATYNLTPDNTIPKDPGIFYAPDQANAIYSFPSTGTNALNDDSQYKLIVRNSDTGVEVTSQTSLVKDFGLLSSPSPVSHTFSLISAGNDNYKFPIKFNSGQNARIYQVFVRFHFTDSTASGVVPDSLDWNFAEQTTASLAGGEVMDFGFVGQDFMKFVGNSLSDDPNIYSRTPGKLDIYVIAASDELNTFIEVNKPSTSIVQDKPEYTNITNGLGLFAARYFKAPVSNPLSSATLDTLSGGYHTCRLKFTNAAGVWTGCH